MRFLACGRQNRATSAREVVPCRRHHRPEGVSKNAKRLSRNGKILVSKSIRFMLRHTLHVLARFMSKLNKPHHRFMPKIKSLLAASIPVTLLCSTSGLHASEADIKVPPLNTVNFDGLFGMSGIWLMYFGIAHVRRRRRCSDWCNTGRRGRCRSMNPWPTSRP